MTGSTSRPSALPPLPHQLLEPDAVRLVGRDALPALEIGDVVRIVALEPDHLAVTLEREDVGCDAVEEPAIVTDDDGASGEAEQRFFQGPERVHVEVVG